MTSLDLVSQAPKGTKLWVFNLGTLECDEGFLKRASGASKASNLNPPHTRRKLVMLAVLIEHPTEGLILFETGAGADYPERAGPQVNDVFPRVEYDATMNLDAQIALTGHSIHDISAVIIGHLHMDHAGGLSFFRNTSIPIYVHELELKHAFYAVATKSDLGVYLPHYLTFDLNWTPIYGAALELAPGLVVHHSPGHTPGLCVLQVNMAESGTWIFTGDQYHVWENWREDVPHGWLARDYEAWVRSHSMIKWLARRTGAKVVLGHCADTIKELGIEYAPRAYN